MEDRKNSDCGCKHIKGIKCDVQNCHFHDGDCYCTAEQIAVGPSSADCSSETLCVTFKPRES